MVKLLTLISVILVVSVPLSFVSELVFIALILGVVCLWVLSFISKVKVIKKKSRAKTIDSGVGVAYITLGPLGPHWYNQYLQDNNPNLVSRHNNKVIDLRKERALRRPNKV